MHQKMQSPPVWSFPGRHTQSSKALGPGPGAYQPGSNHLNSSPKFKVGSERRAKLSKNSEAPGPGAYDMPASLQGPQFSLAGRLNRQDLNSQNPVGPGAYNINSSRSKSAKIGTAPRNKIITDNVRHNFPGPGTYVSDGAHQKGPRWGFGSGSRASLKVNQNPGPGSYQNSGKSSQPAFSMAGRDLQPDKQFGPGPGAYNLPAFHQSISGNIKFGTGKRADLAKGKDGPGPGTYKNLQKSSSGPLFGGGKRGPLSLTTETPGPGTYDAKGNLVDSKGKGWSLAMRYKARPIGEAPGPGMYDVRGKVVGPKWPFGSERRGKNLKTENPGPGAYQLKSTIADVPPYKLMGGLSQRILRQQY